MSTALPSIVVTPDTATYLIDQALNGSTYVQYRTYYSPLIVESFASNWRKGHSSDFANVFGTEEESTDYIWGLIWIAMIVIIVYCTWFLTLLIFCILGQKRVGFLSGKPFERTYYHTNQGQSVNYYNTSNHNSNEEQQQQQPEPPPSSSHRSSGFFNRSNRNSSNQSGSDDDIYIDSTPKSEAAAAGAGAAAAGGGVTYDDDTAAFSNQLGGGGWTDTTYNNNNNSNQQVQALYSSPPPKKSKKKKTSKNKQVIHQSLYSSPPPTSHGNSNLHATRTEGGCKCLGSDSAVWIRRIFMFSGITFITFSILLVTQGITNLQDTVETVNDSATSIEELTAEANSILTTGVFSIQDNATALRKTLSTELNATNLCPKNPDFAEQASDTITQIRDLAKQADAFIDKLNEYAESRTLKSISQSINDTNKGASQVQSATEDVDLTDWEALIILIPYTIIPCFLVVSAIMAAYDVNEPKFHCFMVWVIMPLFILMVLVSTAASAATLMAAASNSDFCLPDNYASVSISPLGMNITNDKKPNSPDVSVLQILQNQGYKPGSQTYRTASFYILQCNNAADPFLEYKEYLPTLGQSLETVNQLIKNFNNTETVAELTAYCDRDYGILTESLEQLQTIVTVILSSVLDMIRLARCDNIVPIYQNTFYNGTCEYSVKASAWVFSSFFITSFFGFLMITFRAAYQPTKYTYTYDSDYGRNSSHRQDNNLNTANINIANSNDNNTFGAGDTVIHSLENYEQENFTYNESPNKVTGAFK